MTEMGVVAFCALAMLAAPIYVIWAFVRGSR